MNTNTDNGFAPYPNNPGDGYGQNLTPPISNGTPPPQSNIAPQPVPIAQVPPNPQMFTPQLDQNPRFVDQLINIQRKNQELLTLIAEGQKLLYKEARQRRKLEKTRFWVGMIGKVLIVAVLAVIYVFMANFLQEALSNLGGLFSFGGPSKSSPAPAGSKSIDTDKLLENPLIQEQIQNFLN